MRKILTGLSLLLSLLFVTSCNSAPAGGERTEFDYVEVLPSAPCVKMSNKVSGPDNVTVYAESESDSEESGYLAMPARPGFYIQTVVEVKVAEVLPDRYYTPGDHYRYRIAKLQVLDRVLGKNIPDEIYLRYKYYDTHIFDGYETFIMSLEQKGMENYMMINEAELEIEYFPNMFGVSCVEDLGYGSVIAFNDGEIDTKFFRRANHSDYSMHNYNFNSYPDWNGIPTYPARYYSTPAEVKKNIHLMTKRKSTFYSSISLLSDYLSAEDVFTTKEALEIKEYLAPDKGNVFSHSLTGGHTGASFVRIIGGAETDEKITIYKDLSGNLVIDRSEARYSKKEIKKAPDITAVIADTDLPSLERPQADLGEQNIFDNINAMAWYRKIDGEIYGIIQFVWSYVSENSPEYVIPAMVPLYYLYDSHSNGYIVEREVLLDLVGDDDWRFIDYPIPDAVFPPIDE